MCCGLWAKSAKDCAKLKKHQQPSHSQDVLEEKGQDDEEAKTNYTKTPTQSSLDEWHELDA